MTVCSRRIVHRIVFLLLLFSIADRVPADAQSPALNRRFETLVLNERFHSEGADVGDLDGDGFNDVVSGPFWYAGPDFRVKHSYAEIKDYSAKGYSDHFFSFVRDFDGDGDLDIFSIAIPGTPGVWYENPGEQKVTGRWEKHLALSSVDNESPCFADIDGDSVEELICIHQGRYGFAEINPENPKAAWTFTAISDDRGYGRFTHGLGVGDLNGDGLVDLLEKDGWWEQPAVSREQFVFHPFSFAQSGGSQMFAYDFDGDGDNDVLSVQNAHGYGLKWFENRGGSQHPVFIAHGILGESPHDNPYGIAISQMHAVALEDIDGDGIKDIVTGKRYWAHGGKDPGANQLPVLYWFRTVRSDYGVEFQPHLIAKRVGVGTQLTTADIDGNGHVDIVIGNKLGTFVALNSGQSEPSVLPSEEPPSLVGSDEFKTAVRTTEPLTPEDEKATFVLPIGFEAELVAAEPDIAKPMNMAFDAKGRLWVSSSVEYPFPAKEGEGRDTIKILEDSNGDGKADKITTFADGLNIPMGLYPYKDGVVCYSIPNIWFLRDTDGDDRCDTREILYGPFDYSRDTHGMCNGFTRGLDGWLYACHGFNNRSSVAGTDGHRIQLNSGNTFRMRLDGTRIEHYTDGQVNPFGMAITPQGDLLTADCHTKPISLLMKGGVYPGFGKPHDGLGFVPDVMDHLHGSTAIGGIALVHANSFPPALRGNSFGGNVMTSRVNRNSIHFHGSTVSAREESDFLISGDPWFRPVDLQLGPDGALYVADFYNRIIGHYEVGLDHPGRDRYRGRIWRIVCRNTSEQRRDLPEFASVDAFQVTNDPIVAAIDRTASSNLTQRMLATDALVDRYGDEAESQIRKKLHQTRSSTQRVHLLWALHRLNKIQVDDLEEAAVNSDALVRTHALQIIAESADRNLDQIVVRALSDEDAFVRRSAAMASSNRISEAMTEALFVAWHQCPPKDLHQRHALRMALRDHLRDQDHFQVVTRGIDESRRRKVIDLCLGIRTQFSGNYLASNLAELTDLTAEELSQYIAFAAKYAEPERLKPVVQMAQERFAGKIGFQEELVRSILAGSDGGGSGLPEDVTDWAESLARHYLGIEQDGEQLPRPVKRSVWNYMPHPGSADKGNPWVLSKRRASSDGMTETPLHSSFPKGESLTGIYRSEPFDLGSDFSFYMAGHDGHPDRPIQQFNLVRLRDGVTMEVIKEWSPPRNDVAQHFHWQTESYAGRSVLVELVDGDSGTAFAWIAVGRFSIEGLNPSADADRFAKAARLIADFQLDSMRAIAQGMVLSPKNSQNIVVEFARAIAEMDPNAFRSAIVEALTVAKVSSALRQRLARQLVESDQHGDDSESLFTLLAEVAKVATAAQQSRLARKLATDREGIAVLIRLVESGLVTPRVLVEESIDSMIGAVAGKDQQERIKELISDLPAEDPDLLRAVASRKQDYLDAGGDLGIGKEVFKKNCSVCHKVAGQGNAVGPNLDGIGNRGLDRVIEDVMVPNRNIDNAFQASVVLTEDGQVISGLVKPSDEAVVVVVDQTGKEHRIAAEEVLRQKTVRTSPMPANFHETLTADEMAALLAYLLSLTH